MMSNGKNVLLSTFACFLIFAVPSVLAHDEQGHTIDIGEVFGIHTPRGKQLIWGGNGQKSIGKIIAALIDEGADSIHAKINNEIAEICCNEKYYLLCVSGYDQKTTDWKRSLSKIERKVRDASFPPREIIEDTLKLSKDIQDDKTFVRKDLSAAACNIEGNLLKLQRALDYGHDFSGEDLKESIRKLKDSLNEDARMPQRSFVEVKERIRDLARNRRLFQWSTYGHRLYFHWGMDIKLRDFRPLKDCVERTCEDLKKLFPRDERAGSRMNELQKNVREKIYSLIEEKWTTRCRTALEDIKSCLGKDSPDKGLLNDDQCSMILEISYYVHILGDFSTTNTYALLEVEKIKDALSKNLTDDLWGHKEGNRKMTAIQNRLVHMDTADELLKFLKAEIPILIEGTEKIRNALW